MDVDYKPIFTHLTHGSIVVVHHPSHSRLKNKEKLCIIENLNFSCRIYVHTLLSNRVHIFLCFIKNKIYSCVI